MANQKEEYQKVMAALTDSVEHLKFVLDESEILTKYAYQLEKNLVQTFSMCMLERLHVGTTGLHLLFGKYLEDRKYEFSIGIILRSLYLDYIILLNASEIVLRNSEKGDSWKEELEEFCLIMLSDTANHTLKYFDANDIPPEKLRGMYSTLVYYHEESFCSYAHDGTKPKLKTEKTFSQSELIKRLKKSKYPHMSRKEDAYIFYSKYDHFGKMYSSISKRQLPNEFLHMGQNLRELPRSLLAMTSLLLITFPEDPFLKISVEKISQCTKKIDLVEIEERNQFHS